MPLIINENDDIRHWHAWSGFNWIILHMKNENEEETEKEAAGYGVTTFFFNCDPVPSIYPLPKKK